MGIISYICIRSNIIRYGENKVIGNSKEFAKEKRTDARGSCPEIGVGLCFVRNLEQGKPTLRMDKVNQLLDLFNYELTATKKL